jgi:hypothetical protein
MKEEDIDNIIHDAKVHHKTNGSNGDKLYKLCMGVCPTKGILLI